MKPRRKLESGEKITYMDNAGNLIAAYVNRQHEQEIMTYSEEKGYVLINRLQVVDEEPTRRRFDVSRLTVDAEKLLDHKEFHRGRENATYDVRKQVLEAWNEGRIEELLSQWCEK